MSEPIWIDEHDTLTLHDRLLAEHGGAVGVRDQSLLQSALMRPRQLHAYGDKTDLVEMAAAYTAGIVRNHPFIDGNKRTALLATRAFLFLNGYALEPGEEDEVLTMVAVADDSLSESGLAAWLRRNSARST